MMRSDGIGDFIMSLPAVNAVRRCYRNARIVLFTCSWQEELAKMSGLFDEIIIWDRSKNYYLTNPTAFRYYSYRMLEHIPALRSLRCDLAIDFKDDCRNRFLMWVCGIRSRVGIVKKGKNVLLTSSVIYHDGMHKSEVYMKLAESLIAAEKIPPYTLGFSSTTEHVVDNFLKGEEIIKTDNIIIIHPVARWESKTWPKAKYAQLSDRLLFLSGVKIVFVGAREDVPAITEIKRMMHNRPSIAAGELTFVQASALTQRASLFIGNDAAPMHMAGILDIPTVALFGSTDPVISRPLGRDSTVIRKIKVRCRGCFKKNAGRCINPGIFCMDEISVEEVYDICLRYLMSRTGDI